MKQRIAFVVPAFNEAATISMVVEQAKRVSETILVVDDGSGDNTAAVARGAGAEVVRCEINRGQGYALQVGLATLVNRGINCICTVDGDGAHDPLLATRLVEEHIATKADLTIGSRFLRPNAYSRVPTCKLDANKFATGLINRVLRCSLSDVASGMRILGRRALELKVRNRDFSFTFELLARALEKHLRISEVPIPVRYNAERLLCTSRIELLDLLRFCLVESEGPTQKAIAETVARVENYRKVHLALTGNSYHFVLVPLESEAAYMIQRQNDWFINDKDLEVEDSKWTKI